MTLPHIQKSFSSLIGITTRTAFTTANKYSLWRRPYCNSTRVTSYTKERKRK